MMALPRFRSRRPAVAITLTSLIDTFSILVFYLLVATAQSGQELEMSTPIQVPVSENLPHVQKDHPIVFLSQDRSLFLKHQKIDNLNQLKFLIPSTEKIFIAADRFLPYGEVDRVIQELQQLGFQQVALLSESVK